MRDLLESILRQTHKDWEILIVDSPFNRNKILETIALFGDPRLRYLQANTTSINILKNTALEQLSFESEWVIFLEQETRLSPDALAFFQESLLKKPGIEWLATNYALRDGTSLAHGKDGELYSYSLDYLLQKRLCGTMLHVVKIKSINKLRFPRRIKGTGSWIFFFKFGQKRKLLYVDHNSAIRTERSINRFTFTEAFFEEMILQGLWKNPLFLITAIMLFLFPKQVDL